MFSPEYAALIAQREADAREHMALQDEWRRRTDAMHAAEHKMWPLIGEPGGKEAHDAWIAAIDYRDALEPQMQDYYRRSAERSEKTRALLQAEWEAKIGGHPSNRR